MNEFPCKMLCDCGQEEKYCTMRYDISGNGVFHQSSELLVKCGKVKEQFKAANRLMRKIRANQND